MSSRTSAPSPDYQRGLSVGTERGIWIGVSGTLLGCWFVVLWLDAAAPVVQP